MQSNLHNNDFTEFIDKSSDEMKLLIAHQLKEEADEQLHELSRLLFILVG